MRFCVYILHSEASGRFYVGFTGDDIYERLRKHNSHHLGYTGKFNDWKIVYSEEYTDKASAREREKQIKSWKSAKKIRQLIAG